MPAQAGFHRFPIKMDPCRRGGDACQACQTPAKLTAFLYAFILKIPMQVALCIMLIT